jgi:hypothetical protein
MHGYDAARVIEADARVLVTVEARDPTLATVVHDIRSYAPKDMRIGGVRGSSRGPEDQN